MPTSRDADARYHLGLLLVAAGKRSDAMAEFKTVLRYNPNHAEARCACRCALRVRTIYRGGCGVHPNHAAQSKLGGGTR